MSKNLHALIKLYDREGKVVQEFNLQPVALAGVISHIHSLSIAKREGVESFVRLTLDLAYPIRESNNGKT